jgi:ribosomal protein L11 methyltransferase
VVANIIAQVLCDLAGPLAAAVRPGGTVIASGIIKEREAEVTAALAARGLQLLERRAEGDWVMLAVKRPLATAGQ